MSRSTVIVAVDVSRPAAEALDWALDYARRIPCELHMIHVVERFLSLRDVVDPSNESLRGELNEVTEMAEGELVKMIPADARAELGAITEHVAVGNPANEICQLARKLKADMVVVGTHGYGGVVEQLVVGSVARKVARDAPCTVVTVKGASTRVT